MEYLQKTFLLFVACSAVISDVTKGKIYNELILTGIFLGTVYQILGQGVVGVLWLFGGMAAPAVLMAGLYYFRMIGAGDVKLFCALGSLLGIPGIFFCMLYALFLGGIFSALLMLKRKNTGKRIHYFIDYIRRMQDTGRWEPYRKKKNKDGEFYFSIPVLLSVLLGIGGIY